MQRRQDGSQSAWRNSLSNREGTTNRLHGSQRRDKEDIKSRPGRPVPACGALDSDLTYRCVVFVNGEAIEIQTCSGPSARQVVPGPHELVRAGVKHPVEAECDQPPGYVE